MHNALGYGVTKERNGLMDVLLSIKPQLLQQRDNEGRIPLHVACIESATPTAGTPLSLRSPNSLAVTSGNEKNAYLSVRCSKTWIRSCGVLVLLWARARACAACARPLRRARA